MQYIYSQRVQHKPLWKRQVDRLFLLQAQCAKVSQLFSLPRLWSEDRWPIYRYESKYLIIIQVSPDYLPKEKYRSVTDLSKNTQITIRMNNSKLTKATNNNLDSLWWRWLIAISAVLILSDQRQHLVTLQTIHNYLNSTLIYSLLV